MNARCRGLARLQTSPLSITGLSLFEKNRSMSSAAIIGCRGRWKKTARPLRLWNPLRKGIYFSPPCRPPRIRHGNLVSALSSPKKAGRLRKHVVVLQRRSLVIRQHNLANQLDGNAALFDKVIVESFQAII